MRAILPTPNNTVLGELDFITVLKSTIEQEVKDTIVREIIDEHVKRFTADLKDTLSERLSKVSFAKVETLRDVMSLRDELVIRLEITGEH
jgi:hypothetical protein